MAEEFKFGKTATFIGLSPDQEKCEEKINHFLKYCSDLHMMATFDDFTYKRDSFMIWQAFKVYCDKFGGEPEKVAFKFIDHVRITKGYAFFERPTLSWGKMEIQGVFIHKSLLPRILESLEKTKLEG